MVAKRAAVLVAVLAVVMVGQSFSQIPAGKMSPQTSLQTSAAMPRFALAQAQAKISAGVRVPGDPGAASLRTRVNRNLAPPIPPPGSGNSVFLGAPNFNSGGPDAYSVAVGDVNGDGKLDVVVANNCNNNQCTNGSVGVLLGNGDGTFQTAVAYSSGGLTADFVALADVNADGKLDLIVTNECVDSNCANGSVSVLLGNGDGTFQPAVTYSSGGLTPIAVAVGDINGDGSPDLMVVNQCVDSTCQHGVVSVLLNAGNGTFTATGSITTTGSEGAAIAVADVNGDGKNDLLVVNHCISDSTCADGSVDVLLGNGNGTFQTPTTYSSGNPWAYGVAFGDVNGDGKLDLVMVNQCTVNDCTYSNVAVLLGNGDGTFQSVLNYKVDGSTAYSIALVDVNGDGKLDVAVAGECAVNNCANASVNVLLGNGDGSFQPGVSYSSGGEFSVSVAAGDANGDGKQDLLVAHLCFDSGNCGSGSVGVLIGNGDGTFRGARNYDAGIDALATATADVNGDGNPDIVVSNNCADTSCASGAVNVLLGNGDGTFQTAVSYNTGGLFATSVVVGDVNGDGKPDMVVANDCTSNTCSGGSVGILLGNGDGTFQSALSYAAAGQYVYSVALADVNGDGKLDVVLASECNSTCGNGVVSVLLGNGDGTFQPAASYSSGGVDAFSIVVADVNGDGKPDILVANNCSDSSCTSGAVDVLLGNGDGTFQPAVSYNSGGEPAYALAVGDVNKDGKPDVVVVNSCAIGNCSVGSIAVLLGNGDGTFQAATTNATPYSIAQLLQTVVVADVNGDGNLDIASGNADALLLGNGDGTFQPSVALGAGGSDIAVADFNRDGKLDVTVGAVTVLLNISSGVTATTTTIASSANPASFGSPVTFTATVASLGTGMPTGSVSFNDGSTALGTIDLSGGVATFATSTLAVGTHSITAVYAGDTNFSASTSNALSQVEQTSSTTTSLSAQPASANLGQSVTFTATVTAASSGPPAARLATNGAPTVTRATSMAPTGSVNFMDGSTQIGSGTLNASGAATLSTSSLAAGTHSITALYGGDSNFNASTSSAMSFAVAAPGFSLSASSLNPASVMPGSSAQSTITITPAGGLDPSTVTLSCSVSPTVSPAATCTVGTVSVANNVGTAMLSVATAGPQAAASMPANGAGRVLMLGLLFPALLVVGAGLRKPSRKRLMTVVAIGFALTGCTLQVACGGKGNTTGTGGNAGTPAGTYTVTVSGSASGMQQTATTTLIVQ